MRNAQGDKFKKCIQFEQYTVTKKKAIGNKNVATRVDLQMINKLRYLIN